MEGKPLTIIEAINKIDNLKPNGYTQSDKIAWLSQLDGTIKSKIIDTHEGSSEITFSEYTDDDLNKGLIVPAPYEDIYIRWLESQIDYANSEYPKYNNSITMYNSAYSEFERWYNRNHMPLGKKVKFF